MSDTPRTDEKFFEETKQAHADDYWPALVAMKEHARQLERELLELRGRLDALEERFEQRDLSEGLSDYIGC